MCVFQERLAGRDAPVGERGQNGSGEGYLSSLKPGPRVEHRDRSPHREPADASVVCRVPLAPRGPWHFAGPQSCKGTHCLGWPCSIFTRLASLPAGPQGRGSPTTSHPGSESPRSIQGPALVVSEAPSSGASSLSSNNTSCFKFNQPPASPSCSAPEGEGHPVHPAAWPLGHMSGRQDFVTTGLCISLPSRNPAPNLSREDPSLRSCSSTRRRRIGTEVCAQLYS